MTAQPSPTRPRDSTSERSATDPVPQGPGVARAPADRALPDFTEGPYRVHFAVVASELEAVQRLRFEVFNLELGEGLDESYATGLDRDVYDATCHHLMVTDGRTGKLVGTYRMQTAEMADSGLGFYTAGEFDLTALPPEMLADSVELGRACIVQDHRNGVVLFALWRGLASYVVWSAKRYLFGCCSLTSQDAAEGRRMLAYLQGKGHVQQEFQVDPLPGLSCGAAEPADGEQLGGVAVPRLFATYLRFGAKACGAPAVDRRFKTIDFFMVIDVETLHPRVRALFFAGLPA